MKVLILSFSSNQVNEDSYIPNKIGLTFSCAQECEKKLKENGNGTEETLKSFDILNHFLETEMVGRIPVTKANFENQKEIIDKAMNLGGN